MKYSKHDYEAVISAFNRTIKGAQDSRESILFNCIDIPTVKTPLALHGCPKYCPFYDECGDECGDEQKALTRLDSDEWQKKKTEFVRTASRYFEI